MQAERWLQASSPRSLRVFCRLCSSARSAARGGCASFTCRQGGGGATRGLMLRGRSPSRAGSLCMPKARLQAPGPGWGRPMTNDRARLTRRRRSPASCPLAIFPEPVEIGGGALRMAGDATRGDQGKGALRGQLLDERREQIARA